MKEHINKRLLTSCAVLALGSTTAVSPASAQQAQGEASESETLAVEEIVVTGSRIARRAAFDMLQPALQLESDFIDERGFTNVGDALGEVPAFGLGLNNSGDNDINSVGQSFANAFGLGQARTLTLINGRRVVSSAAPTVVETGADPSLAVDLNIIPTALIERVETVFTGGAPIYGTDAIAGTVNIILKDDFEGFSTEAQYGISQDDEGETFRIRGLWGGNFADGRGNATLNMEFTTVRGTRAVENEIARQDYDFCENPASAGPEDGVPDFQLCNDATNFFSFPNTALPSVGGDPTDRDRVLPVLPSGDDFINVLRNADGAPLAFDVDGTLRTFDELNFGTVRNAVFSQGGNGVENPVLMSTPTNNALINPVDRFNLMATIDFEIAENVRAFGEFLFSRTEAQELVTTARAMGDLICCSQMRGGIPINIAENPFVSDQLRQTLIANNAFDPTLLDENGDVVPQYFRIARSNLDVEGRAPFFRDQDVFRYVAGFEGDLEFLGRSWQWDTAFIFGKTDTQIQSPQIDAQRFAFAMDAILDPESGEPACRVTVEGFDDPSVLPLFRTAVSECVPFNPLGFNPLTPEQKDFLIQNSNALSENRQLVAEGNVVGELAELPAGPVSVAAGFTHRRERAEFENDRSALNGLSEFGPLNDVFGKFNTTELYGETLIPIVRDGEGMFLDSFVNLFELEGALRFVDNSITGNDVTWTAGGRLAFDLPGIRDSVMLRGNFTQAIRAPSVTELFLPRQQVRIGANDPCDARFINAGPNPDIRRANCEAAAPPGIDLDSFVSEIVDLRREGFTGGNPNLDSEKTDSWTVGAVFEPTFLPGFSLSVDWTSIDITNAIVSLGATEILNACFDSTNFPNVPACNQFTRDAGFQVVRPETGFVNASRREFSGLVSSVSYSFAAADLPFAENMPGRFDLFGSFFHTATSQQEVGIGDLDILAGERNNERLRFQLNLRYVTGPFLFLWQTRHIGSHVFDKQETDEFRPADQSKVSAMRIHNTTLRYQLTDSIATRLVVNNIFDNRDDPLRAAGAGGLNFTDALGRRFQFALTFDF